MTPEDHFEESFRVWDWEQFRMNLSRGEQERLGNLDAAIREVWQLGSNVVLAWSLTESGIEIVHLPYYRVPYLYSSLAAAAGSLGGNVHAKIQDVLSGRNRVSVEDLEAIQKIAKCERVRIGFTPAPEGRDLAFIALLIRRYAILWSRDRAVVLFDIDGFSVLPQVDQFTQLNSLSLSLNRAQQRFGDKPGGRHFSRSTTGDGFYIWNDARTAEGNAALYHLMHMALAHNALTRRTAKHTTPSVRTCFHIGELFEFFQTVGLAPSLTRYIVGDVTVQLARLCTAARPGQILVGDFSVPAGNGGNLGPVQFVERLQDSLSDLEGARIGDEEIESIKCYLTGTRNADGTFNVNKYVVSDKHGQAHYAFNAKINIYPKNADPIWLGILDKELDNLEVAETVRWDQGDSGPTVE